MSADLYRLLLYWDGRQGCIRAHGRHEPLTAPPALAGVPDLTEIDFAPDMQIAQLRQRADRIREMRPDEVAAAWRLLDTLKDNHADC